MPAEKINNPTRSIPGTKEPGNLLVLTHWSFRDALIQTYTLPYVNIIRRILPPEKKIFLVTSEQSKLALTDEEIQQVNKDWQSRNLVLVAHPYQPMGAKKVLASLRDLGGLFRLVKKENISTIHCFCTPAGAIGYLLSKLTGARLVIDSYEPHAESMVENGTWDIKGLPYRLLFLLEKWQSRRASYFICTSAGMKQYAKEKYGINTGTFFVKPACVNLESFLAGAKDVSLLKELNLEHKVVCVYAGKLGGIYLKEEVFDFLAECYAFWDDDFRFLMLTNATHEEVKKELDRVGLPHSVVIQKFVGHSEVPRYLSLGDFAINPVKPVPTKQYCTSIKDGEYWATGLPVVITKNISDDSAIISSSGIGYELKDLSHAEYRNAILKVDELIRDRTGATKKKIRQVAERYRSFQIAEKIYKEIYS